MTPSDGVMVLIHSCNTDKLAWSQVTVDVYMLHEPCLLLASTIYRSKHVYVV